MARWRPDFGVSPNRAFVLVNESLRDWYRTRYREIDVRWAASFADPHWRLLVDAAREELRAELKLIASRFEGTYLIPV